MDYYVYRMLKKRANMDTFMVFQDQVSGVKPASSMFSQSYCTYKSSMFCVLHGVQSDTGLFLALHVREDGKFYGARYQEIYLLLFVT